MAEYLSKMAFLNPFICSSKNCCLGIGGSGLIDYSSGAIQIKIAPKGTVY